MGMDAVTIYISEKITTYPKLHGGDSAFITKLKKASTYNQTTFNRPKPAPDIRLVQVPDEHFIAAVNDSALKRKRLCRQLLQLTSKQIADFYRSFCFWGSRLQSL